MNIPDIVIHDNRDACVTNMEMERRSVIGVGYRIEYSIQDGQGRRENISLDYAGLGLDERRCQDQTPQMLIT